ncbi:MAG: hypothetical protein PUA56_02290 [Bacillales bacterium]|nr:hypothetical protein [Bacillales bacterium]
MGNSSLLFFYYVHYFIGLQVLSYVVKAFLFGKGFVNYLFEYAFFHQGFGSVYVFYHSLIMQILASCGIASLAFMVYHFVEKYRLIKNLRKRFILHLSINDWN